MSVIARHRRRVGLAALGTIAALAGGMGLAQGDIVKDEIIVGGINDQQATLTTDGSATVGYWLQETGGQQEQGCDASVDSPVRLTVEPREGLTATPAYVDVTDCGEAAMQQVVFTSDVPGSYLNVAVSASKSTVEPNNAKIHLTVTPGDDGGGGGSSLTAPDVEMLSISDSAWTNDPVVVTWTIDDGGSALTSTSGDCGTDNGDGTWTKTVSDESATIDGTLLTCTAANDLGEDFDTATVYIDLTDPTISGAPTSGPDGDNNWYVSDVTIHWTCGDLLSGVALCPADETISADGAGQTRNGTATDNAGNDASADSAPAVDVDQTDPTTVLSGIAAGSDVATGTTATCAVSDATSGPVNAAPAATYAIVSDPDGDGLGVMRASCAGRDNAGNTSGDSVEYNTTFYGGTSTGPCFIRQPISCDNVTLFSRGKSIPTKFGLAGDGPGSLYPNGFNTTKWKYFKVAAPTCKITDPGTTETASTQNSSSGGGFGRYDVAQDQYIWNADMRNDAVGTCWKMRVKLLDSTFVGNSAVFKLQK